jgi:hypothetical protein
MAARAAAVLRASLDKGKDAVKRATVQLLDEYRSKCTGFSQKAPLRKKVLSRFAGKALGLRTRSAQP